MDALDYYLNIIEDYQLSVPLFIQYDEEYKHK